eukprot:1270910-Amorphochlora_amoeboformis.AAC.3
MATRWAGNTSATSLKHELSSAGSCLYCSSKALIRTTRQICGLEAEVANSLNAAHSTWRVNRSVWRISDPDRQLHMTILHKPRTVSNRRCDSRRKQRNPFAYRRSPSTPHDDWLREFRLGSRVPTIN